MRKISLSHEADEKFLKLMKELETLNPCIEKQTGPAISALISFVADHGDDSLRQALADGMTSVSRRKRALLESLRNDLSRTEDNATLEVLEKGLKRLKNRLEKPGAPPASSNAE